MKKKIKKNKNYPKLFAKYFGKLYLCIIKEKEKVLTKKQKKMKLLLGFNEFNSKTVYVRTDVENFTLSSAINDNTVMMLVADISGKLDSLGCKNAYFKSIEDADNSTKKYQYIYEGRKLISNS